MQPGGSDDTLSRALGWSAAEVEECYEGILRVELRIIERRANMTPSQAQAFDWVVVNGMSVRETAEILDISPTAVAKDLAAALCRARRVPHVGLFTVLVEVFGWQAVRDSLAW